MRQLTTLVASAVVILVGPVHMPAIAQGARRPRLRLPYAVRPNFGAVYVPAFHLGPDTFKDIAALKAH